MNESRPNENSLSTADIAYPPQTRSERWNGAAVGVVEENYQPGTEIVPARPANETPAADNFAGPLFADEELQRFRTQWDKVQTSFVDEPREAVRSADSLVANVVQRIAEQFAQERDQLERQWDSGANVSTEDLRQSLKRYRALFGRLLEF